MSVHATIGAAVLGVMLAEAARRGWRHRRQAAAPRATTGPDVPMETLLSPSGRFKAVAYSRSAGVLRVEVFRLTEGDADERFWQRIAGPSFADPACVGQVMGDALRAASGE